MTGYSIRKNLRFMVMAFTQPSALVDAYLQETSPWYGLVPFLVATALYEILTLVGSLQGIPSGSSPNPLPLLIPIPPDSYYSHKLIFGPIVNVMDMLLFAGMIFALSRAPWYGRVRVRVVVSFLLFLSTFSLIAVVLDAQPTFILKFLIHPAAGLISMLYLTLFVSRQAGIVWWKALLLILPSLIVYYGFRGVIMR